MLKNVKNRLKTVLEKLKGQNFLGLEVRVRFIRSEKVFGDLRTFYPRTKFDQQGVCDGMVRCR